MIDEASGSNRMLRGGSWNNNAENLRSAYRNNNGPGNRNQNIGFRLVSTFSPKSLPDGRGSRTASPCIGECPDHYPVPARGFLDRTNK